jgi:hypothetical protein
MRHGGLWRWQLVRKDIWGATVGVAALWRDRFWQLVERGSGCGRWVGGGPSCVHVGGGSYGDGGQSVWWREEAVTTDDLETRPMGTTWPTASYL